MSKIDELVNTALFYVGQKEIPQNQGFVNTVFDAEMRKITGFINGESWCARFSMLCIFLTWAKSGAMLRLLKKYHNASTLETWANFKASKEFKTGLIPTKGALCFWKEANGKGGHEGVCSVGGEAFTTAEGNSNNNGSSNGDQVALNHHNISEAHRTTGLVYLGCVYLDNLLVAI